LQRERSTFAAERPVKTAQVQMSASPHHRTFNEFHASGTFECMANQLVQRTQVSRERNFVGENVRLRG